MTGNSIALDTNQAIAWLNGHPGFDTWIVQYPTVYMPVVVLGELRFGALKSARAAQNLARVDSLAAKCRILTVGPGTADAYATLRLALVRKGTPIPGNDMWIAAACVENDIPIATQDAHFSYVANLRIITPPLGRP